jgi:hypothetical protein
MNQIGKGKNGQQNQKSKKNDFVYKIKKQTSLYHKILETSSLEQGNK